MSIAAALAELEKSPALIDHVAYLQQVVAAEQRRREQFHQDFEGKRGEFINGRVYVSPSARLCELETLSCMRRLLYQFVTQHQLGELLGGKCLVHCQRNDYEPAFCFFGVTKAAAFTPALLLFPPPDLIVEVLSPATVDLIRKLKLQDYARHGIGEYWIVDADERLIEQYVLPSGAADYKLKARLPEGGRLVSVLLPGFNVPVAALFDAEENRRTLAAFDLRP